MNATIVKAANHYGFPTVWVDEYATTDSQGRSVLVDNFYVNGCLITAEGRRVRKDGTAYARTQVVSVPVPANVREALAALEVTA